MVLPLVLVPLVVPVVVEPDVVLMSEPEGEEVLVDEQEENAAPAPMASRAITRTDQEVFCVIFIGRRLVKK